MLLGATLDRLSGKMRFEPRNASVEPGRRAFERATTSRAMRHDCVLEHAEGGEKSAFTWRSAGEQVGPEFAARSLAIDWMAARIGGAGSVLDP